MTRVLVSVIAAAVLVGCGGSDGGSNDGTDGATTPTGNTTTAPAGGGGGVAHVEIDGGPTYDAQLAGADQDFPPDDVSLYWAASDGDLTLRFPTFTGTKPTSVSPKIELVIVAGADILLQSNGGECDITVDTADPTTVSGSFDCTFTGDHERVTGTFEANGS